MARTHFFTSMMIIIMCISVAYGASTTHVFAQSESLSRDRIQETLRTQGEQVHFFLERFRTQSFTRIDAKRADAYNRMNLLREGQGFDDRGSVLTVFIALSWWQIGVWVFGTAWMFYGILGIIVLRILSGIWKILTRRPDWDL
ncbi:MAG: hypothetical protein LRY41_02355 [Candidatus Pacebacteria bacterium]|nr:hypothetical protein [Candidatus Paceibacterota bacterium]MCD8507934.1 hypothetical protein [Candidatus Paceibacterota bacterium]MCD8528147.1 hypothetical protein [Candidatus Paceibacterota bacterium]MCD8563657.1 hypothetical protein [Candidatus Paceibacterota bacterium]